MEGLHAAGVGHASRRSRRSPDGCGTQLDRAGPRPRRDRPSSSRPSSTARGSCACRAPLRDVPLTGTGPSCLFCCVAAPRSLPGGGVRADTRPTMRSPRSGVVRCSTCCTEAPGPARSPSASTSCWTPGRARSSPACCRGAPAPLDERSAWLIAYPDHVTAPGSAPLAALDRPRRRPAGAARSPACTRCRCTRPRATAGSASSTTPRSIRRSARGRTSTGSPDT